MKKFENIILASDVDGTFASYGNPSSEKNVAALRYFKENGGKFCFATGRNHIDINTVVKCDHRDIAGLPYVLCNGTYLYDFINNEIIDPIYLEPEHTVRLFRAIRAAFPHAGVRATTKKGFLAFDDDETVPAQLAKYGLASMLYTVKAEDFTGEGVFKVVASYDDFDTVEKIRLFVLENFGDTFSATRSTSKIVEILPRGISKAYRLIKLRDSLKKQNPDIRLWCIGDFDNDIEMLSDADFSVCPANACDKVKAIAMHHVCHCDDGALAETVELIEKSL